MLVRTLIIVLSFLFSTSLMAQEDAPSYWNGKWVLGGALSLENFAATSSDGSDDTEDSQFRFNWNAHLGKHISEKWLIGAQWGITSSNSTREIIFLGDVTEIERSSRLFNFGVFARYHFASGQKWGTYIEPGYLYSTGSQTEEIDGQEDEVDSRANSINLTLGGFYHLDPNWRLTLNIGGPYFRSSTLEDDAGDFTATIIGLDMSMTNIAFGMELLF